MKLWVSNQSRVNLTRYIYTGIYIYSIYIPGIFNLSMIMLIKSKSTELILPKSSMQLLVICSCKKLLKKIFKKKKKTISNDVKNNYVKFIR